MPTDTTMSPDAARKLETRAPLPVEPARGIAVKRDVHEFEVSTDAVTFARAFREVVTDPESRFGLIRVKRPAARLGHDFVLGERFQGCFSLRAAFPRVASLLPAKVLGWIEDNMLSDYGEIVELDDTRLRYRYLEGTPIAGQSTFEIEPLGADRCLVRQIFEFQEVNGIALGTFQSFGLKYHDQVVAMEIHRAAEKAGARVLRATIPTPYVEM